MSIFVLQEIKKYSALTPNTYFHTLAATKTKGTFWVKQAAGLDLKISEIMTQTGHSPIFNSDEKTHRWTPLHVAVIAGNEGAVRYFLSKSPFDSRDDWNWTPGDYAILLGRLLKSPERDACTAALYPAAIAPHQISSHRPNSKRAPTSPDDFEKVITSLVVTGQMNGDKIFLDPFVNDRRRFLHTDVNLNEIAKSEGFTIQNSFHLFPIRDHLMHCPGAGQVICTIPDGPGFEDTTSRAHSSELYFGRNPIAHFPTGKLTASVGCSFESRHFSIADFGSIFQKEYWTLPLYLEKGNAFQVTNVKGERSLLIGEDLFSFMLLHGRKSERFKSIEAQIPHENLEFEELSSLAEEMYALGCLKWRSSTGFVPKFQDAYLFQHIKENPLKKGETWRDRAISFGFLKKFEPTKAELELSRESIIRFKLQKRAIPEMLGWTLGIDLKNIHFIQKNLVHLDNCMMPGPNGSLFVLDYSLSLAALNRLETLADKLEFDQGDKRLLKEHQVSMEKLTKQFTPLVERMQQQLKEAGFNVIPSPGVFLNKGSSISFFNAVTGYGKNGKDPFVITFGCNQGTRLGKALMDQYAVWLSSHISNVKVYFVGRNTFNPSDYSEASGWGDKFTGIHCLTFEL